MVALRAGAATDVGLVRTNNQDSFLVAEPLYAVADGMGGAAAGEVASALAIEALNRSFSTDGPPPTPELLIAAAQDANRAVWDEAEAHPEMRGMGTTLVAIALVEGPQLAIINIGDSRMYVLQEGELRQITFDHNLVAEMVAEGRLTPAEAEVHPRRNIMTRALGVEPEVPVDLFLEEPHPGDRYLLCSDGLPREVSDDLIASLLRRIADPEEVAGELVEEAKRRGGNDNITVVVVDVVDGTAAVPGAADDETGAVLAAGAGAAAAGGAGAAAAAGGAGAGGAAADGAAAGGTATPATGPHTGDAAMGGADPTTALSTTALAAESTRPAPPPPPTRSALTLRVVAFILLFLLILGGAAAAIVWYARSSYYVGLRGDRIVIYQGRPGGVLGLDPTLKESTQWTTADVLSAAIPALKSGQEEPSVSAAHQYVQNLVAAQQAAHAADNPPTSATTTPTSPTSTATATTAPATAGPSPATATTTAVKP